MTPKALAALHSATFETPRPWTEAEFESILEARGVFMISNEAGFALGRAAGPEAELLTLAVAKSQRRAGFGSKLLTEFLTKAGVLGISDVFLEVAIDNTAAIQLYEKFGFIKSGQRPKYYTTPAGTHLDAIIMRKSL